jgi:hypothetical protein
MLDPAPQPPKELPLQECPACGSNWFRPCSIDQYSATTEKVISRVHLVILVCLCGRPLEGSIAHQPSPVEQRELVAFWGSLQRSVSDIEARQDSGRWHAKRPAPTR